MNCSPKRVVLGLLALGVLAIGICMFWNNEWGTPPAKSGLAFILTGLSLWIPHCPIARKIFGE